VKGTNLAKDEYPEYWAKDPRPSTKGSDKLSVEAVSKYNLRNRQGASSVVSIRNFRLDTPRSFLRLYLEHCSYGALGMLVGGYTGQDGYLQRRAEGQYPAWLPEPFLWHTFECLAMAGQLMRSGDLEDNPFIAWDPIVHRDYKLGNVFIGAATKDRYCYYPTLKTRRLWSGYNAV